MGYWDAADPSGRWTLDVSRNGDSRLCRDGGGPYDLSFGAERAANCFDLAGQAMVPKRRRAYVGPRQSHANFCVRIQTMRECFEVLLVGDFENVQDAARRAEMLPVIRLLYYITGLAEDEKMAASHQRLARVLEQW